MYLTQKDGWIEVITGPMFAGKTEELIRRIRVMNQTDSRSTKSIMDVLGIDDKQTISTRRQLGHMGIVDQIMILRMLHKQKPLTDEDTIVMASSGIGFSWAAVTIKFHKNFLNR